MFFSGDSIWPNCSKTGFDVIPMLRITEKGLIVLISHKCREKEIIPYSTPLFLHQALRILCLMLINKGDAISSFLIINVCFRQNIKAMVIFKKLAYQSSIFWPSPFASGLKQCVLCVLDYHQSWLFLLVCSSTDIETKSSTRCSTNEA